MINEFYKTINGLNAQSSPLDISALSVEVIITCIDKTASPQILKKPHATHPVYVW